MGNDEIMVSVVISCHNQRKTIMNAVNSALKQEVDFRMEVIVADDGSTDGSVELLNHLLVNDDNDFKVIARENRGVFRNYFDAFKECKGRYVSVLDGDDYWVSPYKLQFQFNQLERRNGNFCYTDVMMGGKRFFSPETDFKRLMFGNTIPWCTVMFRRSIVKYALHLTEGKKWMVQDLFIALWCSVYGELYHLPIVTANYTVEPVSMSRSKNRWDRTKYIYSAEKTVFFFIREADFKTFRKVIYRLMRNVYSIIFKRW